MHACILGSHIYEDKCRLDRVDLDIHEDGDVEGGSRCFHHKSALPAHNRPLGMLNWKYENLTLTFGLLCFVIRKWLNMLNTVGWVVIELNR